MLHKGNGLPKFVPPDMYINDMACPVAYLCAVID